MTAEQNRKNLTNMAKGGLTGERQHTYLDSTQKLGWHLGEHMPHHGQSLVSLPLSSAAGALETSATGPSGSQGVHHA